MRSVERPRSPEAWNAVGAGRLPGHLGIEITGATTDEMRGRLEIAPEHHAPNGYLHAGTAVTLADTLCGYGTVMNLPDGAVGFTTIELKTNFLGTALDGDLIGVARPEHRGRTTQVWDATITSEVSGKTIAIFRCTQMVLFPR
jgi:1,4-dihydroxy-2-naphthoyl-CoA hydrolase